MAKKKKNDNKDILESVRDDINKKFKDTGKNVASVMSDTSTDIEPEGWISTGDDILDLSISNRPHGGLPLGKYVNIYGDSGLGKSLLVAKVFANAQKRGGIGVYYDTENASYPPYMKVLGVDPTNLLYISDLNTVESIFRSVVELITNFKEKGFTKPLVIAIDSMTAVTTETGADLDTFEKKGYGTGAEKQLLLGEALKKTTALLKDTNILFITTDQIRDNFNANSPWAPKTRSTSGHAQKFWSDIRIELKKISTLKDGNRDIVGHEIQAQTVKNRIAPPYRKTLHYIYNTHGIDNYASWIENANKYNILKKVGGGYIKIPIETEGKKKEYYRDPESDNLPTTSNIKKLLRTNEEIRKLIYERFCDEMIIKYEPQNDAIFDDLEELIDANPDRNMDNFALTTENEDD